MGIRDNFTQALKELTGGGKDTEAEKKNLPLEELVDELEKAVEAYGSAQAKREIMPNIDNSAPSSEAFFEEEDAAPPSFAQVFSQSAGVPPLNEEPVAEPSAQTSESASESANGAGTANSNTNTARLAENVTEPAAFAGFRKRSETDDPNELTIISRNTVIDGNIRSFADMNIDGNVRGDVETTKNIELNGKIIGNITCNNAFMQRSQIQGNISIKGNINIKRDTLLIGDIMSAGAEVNGKVKGNINVTGKADVKGDAVVFGDINASTITVEDGAIIKGFVSTTSLNKEDSRNLFPETVSIGDEN
jgi:cytoskeletal protein CcmA (bactofilin family)